MNIVIRPASHVIWISVTKDAELMSPAPGAVVSHLLVYPLATEEPVPDYKPISIP